MLDSKPFDITWQRGNVNSLFTRVAYHKWKRWSELWYQISDNIVLHGGRKWDSMTIYDFTLGWYLGDFPPRAAEQLLGNTTERIPRIKLGFQSCPCNNLQRRKIWYGPTSCTFSCKPYYAFIEGHICPVIFPCIGQYRYLRHLMTFVIFWIYLQDA